MYPAVVSYRVSLEVHCEWVWTSHLHLRGLCPDARTHVGAALDPAQPQEHCVALFHDLSH